MSGSLALLLAAGIVLSVLAAVTAAGEAGPFLLKAASPDRRLDMMTAPAATPVSLLESGLARTARLDVCLSTLRDVVSASPPSPATGDAVTRRCLAIAEATVERSPLESNVWFIAATLAVRLDDFAKAERYLDRSFRTGPAEQWIAERRAPFAYAIRDRLSQDVRAEADADLALLLRTERGVQVLAARYVTDPGMREHLIGIAETLDRRTQERFLGHIRAEVGGEN
jgi:hypothetical protein